MPEDPAAPFHYWLRFEYGSGGNPRAHGMCYVAGNPAFECVVADEETRARLVAERHHDAAELQTHQEAARALAEFY